MFLNIAKLQNNCEFKFLQNPDDGIETNCRTHYKAKVPSYRNYSIGANLGLQWVEIHQSSMTAILYETPPQIFSQNKVR